MKKVIIISLGNKTGKSLYEQLKSILDEKIYVNFYSIENHIPENLECDLIIFSSDTVKDIIISKITINSKYIIARRIIKNQLQRRVNSYFPYRIKTVRIYSFMKTAAYLSMIFI